MAATVDTIHEFFKQYGWQYEYDTTTQTWLTGFRGDTSNFNVMVHLTDDWLYFVISPFVNAPRTDDCERPLYFHLLRLNHAINMAKFSLDNDGDVVLTVELPTENLDYSEFSDGINALSFYADGNYLDVLNLAQDAEYVPSRIADDVGMMPPSSSGMGPN